MAIATKSAPDYNIQTPQEAAKALLAHNGWPQTQSNINFLTAWYAQEGGNWHNNAKYNPWNTTLMTTGTTGMINNAGVQAYNSWRSGISATSQTLNNGYPAIVSALQKGNATQQLATNAAVQRDLQKWVAGPGGVGTTSAQQYVTSIQVIAGDPKALAAVNASPADANVAPNAKGTGSSGPSTPLMGPCDKAKCLVHVPLGGCLLDQCQAKAFVSGLLVVGGGLVMLLGVAFLTKGTPVGNALNPLSQQAAKYGAHKLFGGGLVTEKQAQKREATAHSQGHSEGRKMAEKGQSSTSSAWNTKGAPPRGASTDDLDFAEGA